MAGSSVPGSPNRPLAEDYTCATLDGRPARRELAGERLARMVRADAEMLSEPDVHALASAVAVAQLGTVTESVIQLEAGR